VSTPSWHIIRPLGQGGFGETTLVEQDGHRQVLKRLLPKICQEHGPAAETLFLQEAEHLKALGDHPQIPTLIDFGVDEHGPWLLQEYIPGENLEQRLASQGALSEAEVVKLLQSLLPVLQTLHSHQVIHRDIKPANIIWWEQQYYLVDFGASKLLSETALRRTGTMIGSAVYAAPEQTLGKSVFASDIYSLGVTCIHLFTRVSPFDLMDIGTGRFVWGDYLTVPVSSGLKQLLDQMLERGTDLRYCSANQVLEDLSKPNFKKSRGWGKLTFLKNRLGTRKFQFLEFATFACLGLVAILAEIKIERYLRIQIYWAIIAHEKPIYYSAARNNALQELNRLGESLENIDLSGRSLYGINLKGANLAKANLENANFSGAELSGANLREANLININLEEANLNQAFLGKANLPGAKLSKAKLQRANLSGANLTRSRLFSTNLSGANLSGASLMYINGGSILSIGLEGTNFSDANLSGANLRSADLKDANLEKAILRSANLIDSNLSATNLNHAMLEGANLDFANLASAQLKSTYLYTASLRYSNLADTNFSGANLNQAKLEGAKFRNTNLDRAQSANNISPQQLRGAILCKTLVAIVQHPIPDSRMGEFTEEEQFSNRDCDQLPPPAR
jgi:uncharacterized protein YjbI with pentapeptide repeats